MTTEDVDAFLVDALLDPVGDQTVDPAADELRHARSVPRAVTVRFIRAGADAGLFFTGSQQEVPCHPAAGEAHRVIQGRRLVMKARDRARTRLLVHIPTVFAGRADPIDVLPRLLFAFYLPQI